TGAHRVAGTGGRERGGPGGAGGLTPPAAPRSRRNGDLLLEPVRAVLAERLAHPPRVEVSSLGEAAVLIGALAVGLHTELERLFVDRRTPSAAAPLAEPVGTPP